MLLRHTMWVFVVVSPLCPHPYLPPQFPPPIPSVHSCSWHFDTCVSGIVKRSIMTRNSLFFFSISWSVCVVNCSAIRVFVPPPEFLLQSSSRFVLFWEFCWLIKCKHWYWEAGRGKSGEWQPWRFDTADPDWLDGNWFRKRKRCKILQKRRKIL